MQNNHQFHNHQLTLISYKNYGFYEVTRPVMFFSMKHHGNIIHQVSTRTQRYCTYLPISLLKYISGREK